MKADWLRVLAITGLAAVSCGSSLGVATSSSTASAPRSTPAATTASSARQQCPAVQSAPQFQPSAPSNRNLEIVWLKGSEKFVVRDITDILHPTTVSTLGENLGTTQFVSANELSIAPIDLERMPLWGSPMTKVASPCYGIVAFAWSPDGTSAAYVTDLSDYSASELHLISGGYNRAVTRMPLIPITGCVAPCGDFVDLRLLYSPNGAYISLVSVWGELFRIWTSDGKLVKSADADPAGPTMSIWSGNSMFFRDRQGVQVWRDGTQSLLLSGVAWIRPRASPGGGQIVYAARDQSGKPNIFILDTRSGAVRMIAKSRSEPAFLNSHLIWYKEERPCVSGDTYPCPAVATTESGKTYIYDLVDNTETESVIATVWDVWPHAA